MEQRLVSEACLCTWDDRWALAGKTSSHERYGRERSRLCGDVHGVSQVYIYIYKML